jgi:hypothetical protein
MKRKDYTVPQLVIVKIQVNHFLAASGDQLYGTVHEANNEVDAEFAL